MSGKRKYIISFSGLSIGQHEYEYQLKDAFFEKLDYSELKKADVRIDVRLNKQSSILILDFVVRGHACVPCDRCADELNVQLKGEYRLFVKLGGASDVDQDEDVLTLSANEGELDIEHILYEYTLLSLPAKRVHAKLSDCNAETINKLKEIEASAGEKSTDPRWDLLKNLKFNN
jgi:uncharacterized protein